MHTGCMIQLSYQHRQSFYFSRETVGLWSVRIEAPLVMVVYAVDRFLYNVGIGRRDEVQLEQAVI
jgi:hypothetical protein